MFNTSNSSYFQKKSKGILSIFEKTLIQLKEVNNQINNNILLRQDIILKEQAQINELEDVKLQNNKVIEKIDTFLN
jgi:hypothetical protein